jgi:hypothetical protein
VSNRFIIIPANFRLVGQNGGLSGHAETKCYAELFLNMMLALQARKMDQTLIVNELTMALVLLIADSE